MEGKVRLVEIRVNPAAAENQRVNEPESCHATTKVTISLLSLNVSPSKVRTAYRDPHARGEIKISYIDGWLVWYLLGHDLQHVSAS